MNSNKENKRANNSLEWRGAKANGKFAIGVLALIILIPILLAFAYSMWGPDNASNALSRIIGFVYLK